MHLVPQVLAFFSGAGAHATGSLTPVTARARDHVSPKKTAEQKSRQGDNSLESAFERGQLELIELTVFDDSGARPSDTYDAGVLCTKWAHAKQSTTPTAAPKAASWA